VTGSWEIEVLESETPTRDDIELPLVFCSATACCKPSNRSSGNEALCVVVNAKELLRGWFLGETAGEESGEVADTGEPGLGGLLLTSLEELVGRLSTL